MAPLALAFRWLGLIQGINALLAEIVHLGSEAVGLSLDPLDGRAIWVVIAHGTRWESMNRPRKRGNRPGDVSHVSPPTKQPWRVSAMPGP